MYDVEQLCVRYAQRRKRGVDPKDIIQELRPYIKQLSDMQRQTLKLRLRTWENDYMPVPAHAAPPAAPDLVDQPVIRRVYIQSNHEEQEPEIVDVICHFCGRLNRVGETMCHACGRLLDPSQQVDQSTRLLTQTTNLFYSDEFFGDDFVLSLKVRGANDIDRNNVYEIRPQDVDREITFGRAAHGNEVDIDLNEHDAEARGVSRCHLSLFYDSVDHVIRVSDRGSANGTFVNGQRINRNEVRMLRNGDELRLGKLVMTVTFYTYDFGS
jgi:hypothetical protein